MIQSSLASLLSEFEIPTIDPNSPLPRNELEDFFLFLSHFNENDYKDQTFCRTHCSCDYWIDDNCCLHRVFMPLDNRLNNIIGTTYKDLGLFLNNYKKLCSDCESKFFDDFRHPDFTVADFFSGSGAMRIAFEQNIGFHGFKQIFSHTQ